MSTSLSEEEIKRLFRIRKTVMEMLKDRNYLVGDFELEMDRRQFVSKYGEHMNREDLVISKSMKNDGSEQIHVFFPDEAKVGVKTIKNYIIRMKSKRRRVPFLNKRKY
ncbi:putative RNA polymerase, Rpb5, RNA polymerase Rpb5 domain superfamily [Helianthus annuus]|nr:putative RNA polymerase, Rpb5, RNA polymerase Rpb5 domain superfamily [Helianthus annuus]KAJ0461956.1 putative RNA polymerase, Rpb5, RNA polymerase Rpb5 domain superfamily [Helianthus annuus]KAJ0646227.1 putative RNA polymerase, Rpb5, RNA polymerase Rpb5 domain superfamily [Helianthus annuus]